MTAMLAVLETVAFQVHVRQLHLPFALMVTSAITRARATPQPEHVRHPLPSPMELPAATTMHVH